MHATVVVMTSSRHMLGFVMCFFSSRRRHTRCALVTGVQTCALPISRMGAPALARIEREGTFVKGLHSIGELDPSRRWIMHFPHELSIKSYGSGYGGNALLGKKCHALRIASHQARNEGWLVEHMLILRVENPPAEPHYIAASLPSAPPPPHLP